MNLSVDNLVVSFHNTTQATLTHCSLNCLVLITGIASLVLLLLAAFGLFVKEFAKNRKIFPNENNSQHIEKEVQATATSTRRVRFSEKEKKVTIDAIFPYPSPGSNKTRLKSYNSKKLLHIVQSLRKSFQLSEKDEDSIILKMESLWYALIRFDESIKDSNAETVGSLSRIPMDEEDSTWISINAATKLLCGSWELFKQSFKNIDSTGLMTRPEDFYCILNKEDVNDEEKSELWIQLATEFHNANSPTNIPIIEYIIHEKRKLEEVHSACMWLRLLRALTVLSIKRGEDIEEIQPALFNQQTSHLETIINPFRVYLRRSLDIINNDEVNHSFRKLSVCPDSNIASLFEIEKVLHRYGAAWKSLAEMLVLTKERIRNKSQISVEKKL
ncbi:DgyrCDS6446 [Dimorphilus gyrociliatus]|uniref:DgyrCDS6446 n=1 Tax=Dimorphilus gyrociliatus TaxID=2664684 RepID=A0A7I8VQD6_9ANNE|nr:DgyrCDS6446 [Dimorphilus gyrociliatus]